MAHPFVFPQNTLSFLLHYAKVVGSLNTRSCRRPSPGTRMLSPVVNFAVASFSTLDRFLSGGGG
jgi:hypothetical protein